MKKNEKKSVESIDPEEIKYYDYQINENLQNLESYNKRVAEFFQDKDAEKDADIERKKILKNAMTEGLPPKYCVKPFIKFDGLFKKEKKCPE